MTRAPDGVSATERDRPTEGGEAVHTLLVASSDLMLAARLEAPARAAGFALQTVSTRTELEGALRSQATGLALLDCADAGFPFLDTHALIRRISPNARCIAVYPHVRAELGEAARDAGCALVLPRSRFFTDIAAALRGALATPQQGPAATGGPQ